MTGLAGAAGRTAIEIPGFAHRNPLPVASRIGDIVASGVLTGRDPGTGEMPTDLATQCANAFHHVRSVMTAAGGSVDDVLKLTVHLSDARDREALNDEWTRMFPDAATRPVRQVIAATLDGDARIHVDILAVIRPRPEGQ